MCLWFSNIYIQWFGILFTLYIIFVKVYSILDWTLFKDWSMIWKKWDRNKSYGFIKITHMELWHNYKNLCYIYKNLTYLQKNYVISTKKICHIYKNLCHIYKKIMSYLQKIYVIATKNVCHNYIKFMSYLQIFYVIIIYKNLSYLRLQKKKTWASKQKSTQALFYILDF